MTPIIETPTETIGEANDAATVPNVAKNRIGFLDLPAELRNEIYDWVFGFTTDLIDPSGVFCMPKRNFSTDREPRSVHAGVALLSTCRQINQEAQSYIQMQAIGFLPLYQKISRRWTGWDTAGLEKATRFELGVDVPTVEDRYELVEVPISHHVNVTNPGPEDVTAMCMLNNFRNIMIKCYIHHRDDVWPPAILRDLADAVRVFSQNSDAVATSSGTPRRAHIDIGMILEYCAMIIAPVCDDRTWDRFVKETTSAIHHLIDVMLHDTNTIWTVQWECCDHDISPNDARPLQKALRERCLVKQIDTLEACGKHWAWKLCTRGKLSAYERELLLDVAHGNGGQCIRLGTHFGGM
ncbi:hypothetical protein K458DRAFT_482702 [Lentithecium fluviatile CBS 122367]|uniref:Uncharacterized protein n=1 Tax=Lentithecium fluviatile CBS 122367 TaxID=1168545 RepID=A0A6G1JPM5_9PLEO|nr:hypothetical protein K458DRAFT_482702 [Lentithecium fluviatile CBS 122367]